MHVGSGLPIGEGGLAALGRGSKAFRDAAADYRRLNAMVVASQADALAKAAATPLNLHQLWMTGLPRHDLVTRSLDRLPDDLAVRSRSCATGSAAAGSSSCGRDRDDVRTGFDDAQRDWLATWCRRHDAVLGVREGAGGPAGSLHAAVHAVRRLGALGP